MGFTLRFPESLLQTLRSPTRTGKLRSQTFRRCADKILYEENDKVRLESGAFSIKVTYAIFGKSNGKKYVGSSYGEVGIWSRWSCYIGTGHGWITGACVKIHVKDSKVISLPEKRTGSKEDKKLGFEQRVTEPIPFAVVKRSEQGTGSTDKLKNFRFYLLIINTVCRRLYPRKPSAGVPVAAVAG